MPDKTQTNATDEVQAPKVPQVNTSDTIVQPTVKKPDTEDVVVAKVASKIADAENILVALSGNPTVDDLAAAIGLSLYLDKIGKHATAIYSGSTPNALEFLKPEKTFETSADALQDFVIALNKDKADHLRYKLDGDYVKIFITPYKSHIVAEDLEFSYGDYNIDLVIALNVANGVDLDAALREHGRIMHDAVIVNVTTANPGKFGEIEWSDKDASSVSEMLAKLIFAGGKEKLQSGEATAFLTGIVAATDRFSKGNTSAETMKIASSLMECGADQQLVTKNILAGVNNQIFSFGGDRVAKPAVENSDPTALDVEHDAVEIAAGPEAEIAEVAAEVAAAAPAETEVVSMENPVMPAMEAVQVAAPVQEGAEAFVPGEFAVPAPEMAVAPGGEVGQVVAENVGNYAEDLQATEASFQEIGAEVMPEVREQPVNLNSGHAGEMLENVDAVDNLADETDAPDEGEPSDPKTLLSESDLGVKPERVVTPSEGYVPDILGEGTNKYGQMLESELADANAANEATSGMNVAQAVEMNPAMGMQNPAMGMPAPMVGEMNPAMGAANPVMEVANPAMGAVPQVANAPEVNGVPEIDYMPMPGDQGFTPPPIPPIDFSAPMMPAEPMTQTAPAMPVAPVVPIAPAMPVVEPAPASLGEQPSMQDQVYAAPAVNPGAFKIPGM